jgi:hypothetical protein
MDIPLKISYSMLKAFNIALLIRICQEFVKKMHPNQRAGVRLLHGWIDRIGMNLLKRKESLMAEMVSLFSEIGKKGTEEKWKVKIA